MAYMVTSHQGASGKTPSFTPPPPPPLLIPTPSSLPDQSDPDLPPDHGSPSPTDEVFDSAPAPPPYMPPQPSIEEARQQMHSLLDDAFALVSPSSQGSVSPAHLLPISPLSLPPTGLPRPHLSPSALPQRFTELGTSPTSVQGLLQR